MTSRLRGIASRSARSYSNREVQLRRRRSWGARRRCARSTSRTALSCSTSAPAPPLSSRLRLSRLNEEQRARASGRRGLHESLNCHRLASLICLAPNSSHHSGRGGHLRAQHPADEQGGDVTTTRQRNERERDVLGDIVGADGDAAPPRGGRAGAAGTADLPGVEGTRSGVGEGRGVRE